MSLNLSDRIALNKIPSCKRKNRYFVFLLLATLYGQTRAIAEEPNNTNDTVSNGSSLEDSWETNTASIPDMQSCKDIDRVLVVPVVAAERPDAITRLAHVPVIALNYHNVAKLISKSGSITDNVSASSLISAEVLNLARKKRDLFENHKGSWSAAEQSRLEELRGVAKNPELANLKPFLSRGIATNEGTGGFTARLCGSTLLISHLSLGHSLSQTKRLPVVVFLDHPPDNVYLSWGMAQ